MGLWDWGALTWWLLPGCLPGHTGLAWGRGEHVPMVSNTRLSAGPRKSSSAYRKNRRRKPRRLQRPTEV